VVFVLLLVFIALLPTLASHFIVPGLLRDSIGEYVDGEVTVEGLQLSWFGFQRVEHLTVSAPAHETDLDLSVGVRRSLIELLGDQGNLGIVDLEVSGRTMVFEDGSLGVARMLKDSPEAPSAAGTPEASAEPTGLSIAAVISVPSFKVERESGGALDIVDGAIDVELAGEELRVDGGWTLKPEVSDDFLAVLHPIFEDLEPADRQIEVDVQSFTSPLDFGLRDLTADITITVGDVTLVATRAGSRLLSMIANRSMNNLDARLGPLRLRMAKGIVRYDDFLIEIGRLDDGSYKQTFEFNGEIDLGSNPSRVIEISAAYPAANLVKIFPELERVPRSLLETLRPTVTFSGPLYNARGDRIPLQAKIDPLDLDGGLKPEQVQGLIKGIGELIRGRE
jgi:hypothetical protein